MLVWRDEVKVKKWDLPFGTFFTEPTERLVEMVLTPHLPHVTINTLKEIDLSLHPDIQNHFVDGGIYRCNLLNRNIKVEPDKIFFTHRSYIPRNLLTDQAHTALSLCLQSRPV